MEYVIPGLVVLIVMMLAMQAANASRLHRSGLTMRAEIDRIRRQTTQRLPLPPPPAPASVAQSVPAPAPPPPPKPQVPPPPPRPVPVAAPPPPPKPPAPHPPARPVPADPRPPRVMDNFRPPKEEVPPHPPINLADSGRLTIGSLVKHYNEYPQDFKLLFDVREFTVANMQALSKGQGVKPVFRLAEPGQGEDWLISLDGINYALPRYKAIYNRGQFRSAGMDWVFACKGLVEGFRYRKLEVVKPANFRERGGGELYMVEQGILELGQGEKEV